MEVTGCACVLCRKEVNLFKFLEVSSVVPPSLSTPLILVERENRFYYFPKSFLVRKIAVTKSKINNKDIN